MNIYNVQSLEQAESILAGFGYDQGWYNKDSLLLQRLKANGQQQIHDLLFIYTE